MLNYYRAMNNMRRKDIINLVLISVLAVFLIFTGVLLVNNLKINKNTLSPIKKGSINNSGKLGKVGMRFRKDLIKEAAKKQEEINAKRESSVPKNGQDLQQNGEYMPWREKMENGQKKVYLTFDDGPSTNTEAILKILNQYNVKATFFVLGPNAQKYPELLKEEANNGEAIGNHTYSHQINYKETPQDFINDIGKCDGIIKSIVGSDNYIKLIRFPGGSWDSKGRHDKAPFRDAAYKAGYRYVDWNDGTDDAEGYNPQVPVLLNNLKSHTNLNVEVVLMHDAPAKTNTVAALPQVIQYFKSLGYTFDTLK